MSGLGGETSALALVPAFTALLWPSTVVVSGCVLLTEHYTESNFNDWWQELAGDRRQIESVINHVHLWDIFPSDEQETEGALERLSEIMAETWRCALANRYPDRRFDVVVTSSPDEYGPTVSFTSVDSSKAGQT